MLCNNTPLIIHRFEHNVLLPEFLGAMSPLKLLKAPIPFLESI